MGVGPPDATQRPEMTAHAGPPDLYRASSVEDAVEELARLGPDGEALAGATWVMRAPIRHERFRRRYVSLGGIEELTRIDPGDPTVVGALATHTAIAALEAGNGPLGSLIEAARTSAFLAIRDTATLAGNICTVFPEADLVPPLLASEAQVDVASPAGRESLELGEYLVSRGARPAGEVVVSVTVPAPAGRRSAYERLTVRGSGEFPLACVAVSVDLEDGMVREARVAVGSVEELPRRSAAAEAALQGRPLDVRAAEQAGLAAAGELTAREGLDAPGWYRLAVLPALLTRAAARLV
jgi:aerobic carbon-monoxide dehydrogenase medium subunit